ncbi:MAG: nucleotidyltransferase domain-containing protein [Chloroflexi bacterium]|nr:nucleotidyltransferase domain-containing protein [Chloroflexota bacterium]
MTETQSITQEQALAAARLCIRLLQERFGARHVLLFGSLAGKEGPWHSRSDIDLAVAGLAPEDFFAAYAACRELLPPGLELDLVPLERVYPEMDRRIRGEIDMPADPILAIKAVIDLELIALQRVVQEMADVLLQCQQPPSHVELRAIASMLHEFYNGAERIFERIAVGLDEGLPRGSNWHADLLNQMALPREHGRPAVIDEPLRARLKEYLDFRHFFRHAYGYTLEWSQLRWKAESLHHTFHLSQHQVQSFFEVLTRGNQ